jgi:hypothetical protein
MTEVCDELNVENFAKLLLLCVDRCATAVSRLRLDLGAPTDRYVALLLHAILDYDRAIVSLIDGGRYTAIPVLTRSGLEAYVDLANLCSDPTYWRNLRKAHVVEWTNYLNLAADGNNHFLAPLANDPSFEEARRMYAQLAQELGEMQIKKLKVHQRFARADLAKEYESLYAMLCAEAHNNVANLESRYLEVRDDELSLRVRLDPNDAGHHYELPCSFTMSELTLRSTEKALVHCGHGTAVLRDASDEFDRMKNLAIQAGHIGQAR